MVDTQKFANDPKRPQGPDGTLQVGSVLQQRYKITGVLGVGGMGSVYLARDMHFPTVTRNVAVKEMLNLIADVTMRENMLKNFEREANILASLTHPAIPKIYDYFPNRDRAYLVMEYINGRDLEGFINSMQDFLPFEMVRKWAIELCDVLSYLHTHQPEPIIFRDVKPSNVMIDSQGNVRLIDFGIAKTFQATQKGKDTMIGTEGYSPPEQYKGEASPAGDIYALGATLHHLLTRRDPRIEPPFTFQDRRIHEINPKVPESFEKIVVRALSYQTADRFPTIAAMKDAIIGSDVVTVTPVHSAPGSVPRPSVNGAASSVPSGAASSREVSSTPVADAGFDDVGVKALWKFQCEDEIRSTPVAFKNTIFIGAYDNNMYALNLTDGTYKWKFPTDGGLAGAPAISADDNQIIFGSEDNNLYTLDARTGKIAWTFQTGGPIRSPVNASLGHAFFGSDDGRLYAVRLSTGRLAWKTEPGTPIRCRPAVTNERVVYGSEGGDVMGLDLTGSIKWRVKAKRAVTSSPVIEDQIAYFGSFDSQLYAVDIIQGWVTWRYRTGKAIVAAPLVVGKVIYVASADGILYALDVTANGRELWRFHTDNQLVAAPVFSNGVLYFGSVDKKVYSIEAKKGKLRWTFETEGPIAGSPLVVDRTVYIGSLDHYLYALNA